MNPRLLGAMGEQQAAKFLRRKGYDILAANFALSVGEIDLVCQYKKELIFCEVKTRTVGGMLDPKEAVDYRKQERIKSTASAFINRYRLTDLSVRYDIIEVLVDGKEVKEINHIESAF